MLRLEAVAVYEYNPKFNAYLPIPDKVASLTRKFWLFNDPPLVIFEKKTLPFIPDPQHAPDLGLFPIYRWEGNGSRHYVGLFKNPEEPGGGYLCVIVVNGNLNEKKGEHIYLLLNLSHIHKRGQKLKYTLQDMLNKPKDFLDGEIHIPDVQNELAELKIVAMRSLALMHERGDTAETVQERTERLLESSAAFKLNATKLEDSHTCCGGARRKVWG